MKKKNLSAEGIRGKDAECLYGTVSEKWRGAARRVFVTDCKLAGERKARKGPTTYLIMLRVSQSLRGGSVLREHRFLASKLHGLSLAPRVPTLNLSMWGRDNENKGKKS